MSEKKINLVIVDDHAVVRKGIRALLATEEDLEILAEGEDGTQAIKLYQEFKPDILLLDLLMNRSFQPLKLERWAIF